ncbi:YwdI family protein [Pseudalkalibacillus berkeleyi]|uniref:YwdI family protein n=1 Tax=Pseudalkalibacillus berkeleyi TaxID=1069813 RepID=A0ABS9H4V3_9BACL|nr:YwdI family protein [Pseudalkalibacillus berkeleyi]MCF6138974.1 YwdI family protein [Pseudalkalibacillus berkeleyi]
MSIKSSIVVQKMIDRLEKIKEEVDENASSSSVRDELSAIKAYCDLLMEVKDDKPSTIRTVQNKTNNPTPVQNISTKRLKEDDDVNGDSIFDF